MGGGEGPCSWDLTCGLMGEKIVGVWDSVEGGGDRASTFQSGGGMLKGRGGYRGEIEGWRPNSNWGSSAAT